MSCYRLTFENDRAFCVRIEPTIAADRDAARGACTAVIYRVTNGKREPQPLHRVDGGPIQIIAVSEPKALEIASDALREVTGAALRTASQCHLVLISPPALGVQP